MASISIFGRPTVMRAQGISLKEHVRNRACLSGGSTSLESSLTDSAETNGRGPDHHRTRAQKPHRQAMPSGSALLPPCPRPGLSRAVWVCVGKAVLAFL